MRLSSKLFDKDLCIDGESLLLSHQSHAHVFQGHGSAGLGGRSCEQIFQNFVAIGCKLGVRIGNYDFREIVVT